MSWHALGAARLESMFKMFLEWSWSLPLQDDDYMAIDVRVGVPVVFFTSAFSMISGHSY